MCIRDRDNTTKVVDSERLSGTSGSFPLLLQLSLIHICQRGQMPLSQPVLPQMELYSSHSRLSISVRRL